VHDRLGDRVEYFPRSQEELEEAAAISSMVSRGVDQDTEKKAAVRKARRVKQGGEL